MKYALRKLIAFVFLGGMVWFVYQDLDNVGKPWFMNALGALTLAFAAFVLLVPSSVVWFRIARRRRRNRAYYAQWRARQGPKGPAPMLPEGFRREFYHPGELPYWHERGTLYAQGLAEADDWPAEGAPSDVAFPRFGTARYRQRTHAYFTNRRVFFAGKHFTLEVPFDEIESVRDAPGGIVFAVRRDYGAVRLALTSGNPLALRDVISYFAPSLTEKAAE